MIFNQVWYPAWLAGFPFMCMFFGTTKVRHPLKILTGYWTSTSYLSRCLLFIISRYDIQHGWSAAILYFPWHTVAGPVDSLRVLTASTIVFYGLVCYEEEIHYLCFNWKKYLWREKEKKYIHQGGSRILPKGGGGLSQIPPCPWCWSQIIFLV